MRRILREEWATLRGLRLEALRSDPLAFGGTLEQEAAFPEERWRSRAEIGAESPGQATLVAVLPGEDRWLGMAIVVEEPHGRSLYGMWVRPDARQHGVGGLLLDRAIAWSGGGRPESEVRLEVNPQQTAAVRLYRSRGFEFTDRSRPLEHTAGAVVREMVRPARGAGSSPACSARSRGAADPVPP